jgi:hypothetical protein
MNYGVILQPGEKITKVIHRSLISLLPTTGLAIFLAIVGIGFAYFELIDPASIPFGPRTIFSLISVLLGLAVIIFPIGLFSYEHNVLIFTNLHLIEVEQTGLFGRVVSQVSFNREQDITGRRTGVFSTIFDYGDVEVQSAGEERNFIFHYAPNPEAVAAEAIATNEASMNNTGQGLG